MSKSHIQSNLILDDSLVGVDDSMVAYFPFKYTANDSISETSPAVNNNNTLTGEGIAVEEATTNLFGDISTLSVVDANNTITESLYPYMYGNSDIIKITKIAATPSTHASFRKCPTCLQSTAYTVSWKLKVLSGSLNSIGVHFGGGTSGPITPSLYLGDGWYQFYYTATTGLYTGL